MELMTWSLLTDTYLGIIRGIEAVGYARVDPMSCFWFRGDIRGADGSRVHLRIRPDDGLRMTVDGEVKVQIGCHT